MDDILLRFPHVFGAIISNLNDKDLTNCRLVSKTWKNGIGNNKCLYQRFISKLINSNSNKERARDEEEAKYLEETNAVKAASKAKNWKQFLLKAPVDILKEITKGLIVCGFGKHEPGQEIEMHWWVLTKFCSTSYFAD